MSKASQAKSASTAENGSEGGESAQTKAKPALDKSASGLFGEIVHLMMLSPAYKHLFLADLEWALLPPFLHKQFRLFSGPNGIIAVALWASVSEEVDKELSVGRTRLKPAEWKSGDKIWLMEIIAPSLSGDAKAMERLVAELSKSAFAGRKFKARRINAKTGKMEAVEIQVRNQRDAEKAAAEKN